MLPNHANNFLNFKSERICKSNERILYQTERLNCLYKRAQMLTCQAIRSIFSVRRRVFAPNRADASAASQPACPPPTTMTSNLS